MSRPYSSNAEILIIGYLMEPEIDSVSSFSPKDALMKVFDLAIDHLLSFRNVFIVPTPLEEEIYTQMGFFCSVNFRRSIYSS